MGELLKALETKEAGGSLDGVHGAEDICDQFRIFGPCLEVGETALHSIQAFLALNQELSR